MLFMLFLIIIIFNLIIPIDIDKDQNQMFLETQFTYEMMKRSKS